MAARTFEDFCLCPEGKCGNRVRPIAVTGLVRGGSEKLTFVSVRELKYIYWLITILIDYKIICCMTHCVGSFPRIKCVVRW